jgi:hypothetical protein
MLQTSLTHINLAMTLGKLNLQRYMARVDAAKLASKLDDIKDTVANLQRSAAVAKPAAATNSAPVVTAATVERLEKRFNHTWLQ